MKAVYRAEFVVGTKGDHAGLYDGSITMLLEAHTDPALLQRDAQQRLDEAFGKGRFYVGKVYKEAEA